MTLSGSEASSLKPPPPGPHATPLWLISPPDQQEGRVRTLPWVAVRKGSSRKKWWRAEIVFRGCRVCKSPALRALLSGLQKCVKSKKRVRSCKSGPSGFLTLLCLLLPLQPWTLLRTWLSSVEVGLGGGPPQREFKSPVLNARWVRSSEDSRNADLVYRV